MVQAPPLGWTQWQSGFDPVVLRVSLNGAIYTALEAGRPWIAARAEAC